MNGQHAGALMRMRAPVRHFDAGGAVEGPQAPGFVTGPTGAPEFAPGGFSSGNGALGASLGGTQSGGSTSTGASSSGGSSGGMFGLSGRDIAAVAGSGILGALGTMAAGPFGGLAGSVGGRLAGGALYDYFAGPSTAPSNAPAPQMQVSAEPSVAAFGGEPAAVGLGGGALSGTQTGALNSMGSITGNSADVAGPNIGGDITAGADVNSGDPGENTAGSGLHARGGRIRRTRKPRTGALEQRLGGAKR